MEQFQQELQGEPSEDPLWTSPTESEHISDSDLAEQHFGQEPPNLEEYMQTEDFIQECFPLAEESEQSEHSSSDTDTDDSVEMYISEGGEIYMSEVDLTTESSDMSDESDESDGSDAENDSNEETPEN